MGVAMNKSIAVVMLCLSSLSLSSCTTPAGPNQTAGAFIGGAGGAIIGSQFGHGGGAVVGGAVGLLGGALIGSEIGRSVDIQQGYYDGYYGGYYD